MSDVQEVRLKPYSIKEIIQAIMIYGFGVTFVMITMPLWIWPVLLYQLIFYIMVGIINVINKMGLSKFSVKVICVVVVASYFIAKI